jgi:hypothetical protein
MGVHILSDDGRRDYPGSSAVLYCSTTDWAFGPVFSGDDDHDASERAEAFCRWLRIDPRTLTDTELEAKYSAWRAQEAEQWKREDATEDDDDPPR